MPIAEDTRRLCDEIFSLHLALGEGTADRQRSVGQFLKEARESHFEMAKDLRASLANGERQRLADASEFAFALAEGTQQRTREVGSTLDGFREENEQRAAEVREFLGEVREDMQSAAAAWRGLAGKFSPAARSGPFPTAPTRAGPRGNDKETQILNVVMGHPRGLKLADIGKMLGADWRSLNAPTRSLVAAGKLRKVENLYFAV